MKSIKVGDRVQLGQGATARVIAVVNGTLYRIRYDHADPIGNQSGDYLAHVLRPYRGKRRGWTC